MKLSFVKLSPTRNITILVADPLPRELHAAIAERLMDSECVGGEQVGFIEAAEMSGARARLQMMGGEFCGNASMSLAAWLAYRDGLADGASVEIPLEVSGAEGLVVCRIEREGKSYSGTVAMPAPLAICEEEFGEGQRFPVVHFPGISHAIVPENVLTPGQAKACIAAWCEKLDAEAMGILLFNEALSEFIPLVYVRSTGSAVWEHGCGSGTAAIGAYLAAKNGGSACCSLKQPGGSIYVQAADGKISITGTVKIISAGHVWLDVVRKEKP